MTETDPSVQDAREQDARDSGYAEGRQETIERMLSPQIVGWVAEVCFESATSRAWVNQDAGTQEHWLMATRHWIKTTRDALVRSNDD